VNPEDKKALITREKYTTLYNSGALQNMKVNESLLIEEPNPKQNATVIAEKPYWSAGSIGLYQTKASTMELTEQVDQIYNYLYDKQKESRPSIEMKMDEKATVEEEEEEEEMEDADFDEEMNENILATTPGESRIREFEASFISQLIIE